MWYKILPPIRSEILGESRATLEAAAEHTHRTAASFCVSSKWQLDAAIPASKAERAEDNDQKQQDCSHNQDLDLHVLHNTTAI